MRIVALIAIGACAACTRVSPDPAPSPALAKPARAVPCHAPPPPAAVALPGKAIAVREVHACALLDTGHVWCWGNNDFEQAGSATRASATAPHDLGLDHVVAISLGHSSGCARHADGTTTWWGRKTSWNPSLPESLAARPPAGRHVDQIAAGHDHACAIVGGAVDCYGALGNFAGFGEPRISGVTGATAIAAGDQDSCAIVGGAVTCWGAPWEWSCGEQCERDKRHPSAHRVPGIVDATAIAVGSSDACAVHARGKVSCWGAVDGARQGTTVPIAIPGIRDARQVAVGPHHACAVRATGEIACWGEGDRGARGDGRIDEEGEIPSTVDGITDAIAVGAGLAMSCALHADGRVTCWGINDHRQLGFDTLVRDPAPADVCELDGVTALAASYAATCALHRDGTVARWGAGAGWRDHSAVPAKLAGATNVVGLAGSEQGICALDRSGDVHCRTTWREQLKLPGAPVRQIALGKFGLCGVAVDGSVICNGERVAGIVKATKVTVGDQFACALAGSRVTCWGPAS